MNKSLITNLVSIFIILVGFLYHDEFSFIFLVGCNDLPLKKGKKGDFSFRKCTSCKITN